MNLGNCKQTLPDRLAGRWFFQALCNQGNDIVYQIQIYISPVCQFLVFDLIPYQLLYLQHRFGSKVLREPLVELLLLEKVFHFGKVPLIAGSNLFFQSGDLFLVKILSIHLCMVYI